MTLNVYRKISKK